MGKLDQLIARLGPAAGSFDVLRATAGTKGPLAGYAQELIGLPRADAVFGGVDDFLRQHGGALGPPIGRGRESLVFAVRANDDGAQRVLKMQAPGAGRGFTLPTGIPGVAGYAAKERFPSGLQIALQDRAARVFDDNHRARFGYVAEESQWMSMADAVQRSLAARGMEWTDPHAGNIGVMPDGNMAVIDGAVVPNADEPLRIGRNISPEDAIRMLRAPAP